MVTLYMAIGYARETKVTRETKETKETRETRMNMNTNTKEYLNIMNSRPFYNSAKCYILGYVKNATSVGTR